MINVKISGIKKLNYFENIDTITKKELSKKTIQFSKFVQKSAKLRAPRFSGQLAESIKVVKINDLKVLVVVDSPYGAAQEYGFTPNFLSSGMAVKGGYRIGDWMQAKGISGFGITPSGKPHPFIKPAVEKGLSNLPNMLQNMATKIANGAMK